MDKVYNYPLQFFSKAQIKSLMDTSKMPKLIVQLKEAKKNLHQIFLNKDLEYTQSNRISKHASYF